MAKSAHGDVQLPPNVSIRGARQNNLKNVDVDIPRDKFVIFTGISGSGKSSLAFGTIYAESQRRYLESIAPYGRRLIEQAGVSDVTSIVGLPPAVALKQSRGATNARSTVGSLTTVSSLVRMLYSRVGHYPARQTMLYAEDFSPNTPEGACETCHGLGRVYDVTESAMVPNPNLSISKRAIAAWPTAWGGQNLRAMLVSLGFDVDRPWRELSRKDRDWILFTDEQPSVPVYAGLTPEQVRRAQKRGYEPSYMGAFIGVRRYVLDTFHSAKSAAITKKRAEQYISSVLCPTCHGKRLKKAALSVTFAGHDIADFNALTLLELRAILEPVAKGESSADITDAPEESAEKKLAAQRLAGGLIDRLSPLIDLGLGYISLDRSTPTLSSGELQRLRLATQLSADLFGVVYVLDEPSAGLHPADGESLLLILDKLRRAGNSLFVVEHNLALIQQADWIIDVGPGAGEHGGKVLYSGPLPALADVSESITRRYLFDTVTPDPRTPRTPASWIELKRVTRNNIQDLDVSFPIGCLTAVTGISGSGKSSLVAQALPDLIDEMLGRTPSNEDEAGDDVDPLLSKPSVATIGMVTSGQERIRRQVRVDQKPIGRTPRSNLATYSGLFDHVRRLFATTPLARRRHYSPSRFSFNVAGGRCPVCNGEGFVMVELLFLPSVYAPCSVCHGARYNPETLEVTWQDRTIADVLAMTVDDAWQFFANEPAIHRSLTTLRDIGLGYLRLGQPATELSGGEAQRVKLATELQRAEHGTTLYILDEPTAGLHPADADRLLQQLQRLVDADNTVVIVEHDMRIVAQTDYVIDMGPGAGDLGGTVVAHGTPQEVAKVHDSATAPFLKKAITGKK